MLKRNYSNYSTQITFFFFKYFYQENRMQGWLIMNNINTPYNLKKFEFIIILYYLYTQDI